MKKNISRYITTFIVSGLIITGALAQNKPGNNEVINIKNNREFFWDETMIDVSKTTAKPKIHQFVRRERVITI